MTDSRCLKRAIARPRWASSKSSMTAYFSLSVEIRLARPDGTSPRSRARSMPSTVVVSTLTNWMSSGKEAEYNYWQGLHRPNELPHLLVRPRCGPVQTAPVWSDCDGRTGFRHPPCGRWKVWRTDRTPSLWYRRSGKMKNGKLGSRQWFITEIDGSQDSQLQLQRFSVLTLGMAQKIAVSPSEELVAGSSDHGKRFFRA